MGHPLFIQTGRRLLLVRFYEPYVIRHLAGERFHQSDHRVLEQGARRQRPFRRLQNKEKKRNIGKRENQGTA